MEKYYIFEVSKHVEAELNNLKKLLSNFEYTGNYSKADFIVSYGGDGTLLDCFHKYLDMKIYPIRDYCLCEKHKDYIQTDLIENKFDVLVTKFNNNQNIWYSLSEIVIRNKNLSSAMRCNLKINDKMYAENIIGDGLIFATSLGSTGYFKSVTNTFFTNGIGIGFINNTQNMTNFIIDKNSKIEIELVRGECQVAADHTIFEIYEGTKFGIELSKTKATLINYKDGFMCPECRKERHSANVNSLYKVF